MSVYVETYQTVIQSTPMALNLVLVSLEVVCCS